jgi:hypothetical protein
MAQNIKNPATLAACRARNTITATAIGSDHKSTAPNLQDSRAHWLARRFNLSIAMAAAVADLHFGEVTR